MTSEGFADLELRLTCEGRLVRCPDCGSTTTAKGWRRIVRATPRSGGAPESTLSVPGMDRPSSCATAVSVLGQDHQLVEMDERLAELNLSNPEEVDDLAAALFGGKEAAARNWHDHYRTWRKKRLAEMARSYGDKLDEVALFLAEFANQITQIGPKGYLQAMAHKKGEPVDEDLDDRTDD